MPQPKPNAAQLGILDTSTGSVSTPPVSSPDVEKWKALIRPKTVDPAAGMDLPANLGRPIVPHVSTFQGMYSGMSNAYHRWSDEAMQASLDNARYMLNDVGIMECLEHRQRATALLNWHIAPEDDKDQRQKEAAAEITSWVERTPRFMQMRKQLLWALWYGKHAVQFTYERKRVHDASVQVVKQWKPINGDKLVFRFDAHTGEYLPDQIGIRVGTGWASEGLNTDQIQATDWGMAYYLEPWEREFVCVHYHEVEDGEFESPWSAGRIHGVGIRHRLYWEYYQAKEVLAYLLSLLERSASGLEIWYYPWGSEDARQRVMQAATERLGDARNVILCPRPQGPDTGAYGVEHIEAGYGGAAMMLDLLKGFFGERMKRYILGQTLTTEASATGLGSNLASIHLDTFLAIVKYDATNLEETITREFVEPLIARNRPDWKGLQFRFVIDTEQQNSNEKLQAYAQAWQMGAAIKAEDVYDTLGSSMPNKDDKVLVNPQIDAMKQQIDMQRQQMQIQQQQAAQAAAAPAGAVPGQPPGADRPPPEGDAGPGGGGGAPPAPGDNSAPPAQDENYSAGSPDSTLPLDKEADIIFGLDQDSDPYRRQLARELLERVRNGGREDYEAGQQPLTEQFDAELSERLDLDTNPDTSAQTLVETPVKTPGNLTEQFDAALDGEKLVGGTADGVPDGQFDPDALAAAIGHEMEHTDDPEVAKEIAKDHLAEDPQYYEKLKQVEGEKEDYAAYDESKHARAPKGQPMTIDGRQFVPGEWIPKKYYDRATPAQRALIDSGGVQTAGIKGGNLGLPGGKPSVQSIGMKLPDLPGAPHGPKMTLPGGLPAVPKAAPPQGQQAEQAAPNAPEARQQPAEDQGGQAVPSEHAALAQRLQGLSSLKGSHVYADASGAHVRLGNGQRVHVRYEKQGELAALAKANPAAVSESQQAAGQGGPASIAGAYRNGEVILSRDASADEINHELIHAGQDMGVFSKDEIGRFGGHEQMASAYQKWVAEGKPTDKTGVMGRVADYGRALFGDKAAKERIAGRQREKTLASFEGGRMGSADQMTPPDPSNPQSGINGDGTVNGAKVLFATRKWADWADKFAADPENIKRYGADNVKRFVDGMALTAATFGDFSQLPEEGAGSPIRQNSDPLFKKTADSSTICPEQDQYVSIINALQQHYGKVFTKDKRFLLGQMMEDAGWKRSCWFCYGQSARDAAADLVDNARSIFGKVSKAHASGEMQRIEALPEAERNRALNQMFTSEAGNKWSWGNIKKPGTPSKFAAFIKQHHADPEVQKLFADAPRLHDLAMGYKAPQSDMERKALSVMRANMSVAQINIPKGWSSYKKQFLTMKQELIDDANKAAGQRFNSQTDFRIWHILEMSQMLAHLGRRGGMAHAYTRQPEMVEIFGNTGMKFNLSVGYATWPDGRLMRGKDGSPEFDMIGMPKDKALGLRSKFKGNVGTMLVPTNVEQVVAGLDDPNIDMMIPYHAGAVPKSVDKFKGAVDFSDFQHEHGEKWEGAKEIKTLDGRTIAVKHGQPLTREHHKDNREIYLDLCGKLGLTPRYEGIRFTEDGPADKDGQPMWQKGDSVTKHPNYMKLVRDVAATEAQQQVVDAMKVDWDAAERHAQTWMKAGGHQADTTPNAAVLQILKERIDKGEWPTSTLKENGLGGLLPIVEPAQQQPARKRSGKTTPAGPTAERVAAAPIKHAAGANTLVVEFNRAMGQKLSYAAGEQTPDHFEETHPRDERGRFLPQSANELKDR